jgi:hypothetical protein
VEQGRPFLQAGRTDEEIVDRARDKCFASNLASGSAVLFALIGKGATREQAVEQGARLREEIEREAVAILRASPDGAGDRVAIAAVTRRLDIPDEIAPAIVPYMMCLSASAGTPVYTEGKKRLIPPPPGIGKGAGCSAQRARAAVDAEQLLRRRGGRNKKARRALIEKTLAEIDAFERAPAAPPRAGNDR